MAKQKRVAKRVQASTEDAARWRKAVHEEEACREATIAQAREMRDASRLARKVIGQLRDARERQGLSLADLKERTGMGREAISRLENNEEPNPTIATLVRLASAVGVQLDMRIK